MKRLFSDDDDFFGFSSKTLELVLLLVEDASSSWCSSRVQNVHCQAKPFGGLRSRGGLMHDI